MEIPFEMWGMLLLISIGCALYLIFIKDYNNYSEVIAGFLSFIFFVITGYSLFIGIVAENSTVNYSSVSLGWIFIIIGLVVGILTFVRVLDVIATRKKEEHKNVNMSPIRL